jgi:hypothetical protein
MDETSWQKQLLIGVVMLLVVGGLIGVVVAVAGLKVADLAGVGTTGHTTSSGQRLHVPRNVGAPPAGPSTTQPPASSTGHTTKPPAHLAISLTVNPTTARSLQRINLTGTYTAPDGTELQVQRRENGVWTDFPTTARVNGGAFATYIETAHIGSNHLRVTDKASGRSSNVATVVVL